MTTELANTYEEQIVSLTAELLDAVRDERAGLVSSNEARLRKGKYLTELERVGQALDAEQLEDLTPLQWAQAQAQERLHAEGIFDVPVDDYNARAVYKALEPHGGLGASFRDTLSVNPATGEPVMGEDGEPFTRNIGEVSVNKLFYVRNLFDVSFDKAASFARRFTEQDLRQLNKLASVQELEGPSLVAQMEAISGSDEPVRDYVRGQLGDTEAPDFRNIRVTEALYHGPYERTLAMASLVMGSLGQRLDDESARLSNTRFMELLLGLFDPQDFGPTHLLEAMARLGEVDEAEIEAFADMWDNHGLAERWDAYMGSDDEFDYAAFEVEEDETLNEMEQEAVGEQPGEDYAEDDFDLDALVDEIADEDLPF